MVEALPLQDEFTLRHERGEIRRLERRRRRGLKRCSGEERRGRMGDLLRKSSDEKLGR